MGKGSWSRVKRDDDYWDRLDRIFKKGKHKEKDDESISRNTSRRDSDSSVHGRRNNERG